MKQRLTFIVLILTLILPSTSIGQIPNSRKIDWSKAGVIGGIPNYTTTKNFLNNGGIANDPNKDNSPALQNLINAEAGKKVVIYFPSGTYRFKQKVNFPRSGQIILRGDGADKTKFEFETGAINEGNFNIRAGSTNGTPKSVTGGATKGSTKIDLNNTTGLNVGDWIDISQDNDLSVMTSTNPPDAPTHAPRAVGQLMKIIAINGNTITVDRPLHYTYSMSHNVQAQKFLVTEGVGFENFTITSVTSGDKSHFFFVYAANCWLKCINSIKSVSTHVNPAFSANLTIRDSHFNDSWDFGGGGHGYGVAITSHSTHCLVENNIFDKLRHAMLVQRGANGNVFGYNYSINATKSDGTISPLSRLPDISVHGHFAYMNLYEGNIAQQVHSSDYWGPAGNGNTFFRNRITREGVTISDNSVEQNIVGNNLTDDGTTLFPMNDIVIQSGVNTLIHGNYIDSKGTTDWDPALGKNNLINSYYLSSKPAFFGGMSWPNMGPGLPSDNLPAKERHGRNEFTACESAVPSLTNNATFVSQNAPTSMLPGATASVTVVMKNTGTTTWNDSGTNPYSLGSENPQDNTTWGTNRVKLPQASIAPGVQATFQFNITAPSTPGTYDFQWKMVQDGVEWFGALTKNLQIQVIAPKNDAAFANQNVPDTMEIGATANVSIEMNNTGNTTWTNSGTNPYRLGSLRPQNNKRWGTDRVDLPQATISAGGKATFNFNIIAPATPGTYDFQWKMSQDGIEWFGNPSVNKSIVVIDPDLTDVEMVSVSEPFSTGCEKDVIPMVVIKNNGPAELTTANIEYSIDGGTVMTKSYTMPKGSGLLSGMLISLKGDTSSIAPGTHTLKIWSSKPNKKPDQDPSNDTISVSFVVSDKGQPLPFTEDFQAVDPGKIPAKWTQNNPDDYGSWFVHKAGTNKAVAMNNFAYTGAQNESDALTLPPLDFTGNSQVWLSFDYSHASRPNATDFDSLEVALSTDCGNTFSTIWAKGGKDLNTVPDDSTIFIPSGPQDFENIQINLTTYSTLDNVMIRFVNWSNNGNSTLIDNVNIVSGTLAIKDVSPSQDMEVYPIPANKELNIGLDFGISTDVELHLINTLGQVVFSSGNLILSGSTLYKIDVARFEPGTYIIIARSRENLVRRRVLIIR